MPSFVLTLACPDRVGIVHTVSGFLADHGCNIVDSQQFGDAGTETFFMRLDCTAPAQQGPSATAPAQLPTHRLRELFAPLAQIWSMSWQLTDSAERCRTLIMVSQYGHCLNDLLYRWQSGALAIDVVAVVSNHPDFRALAASYGVPFHELPITVNTKADQEQRLATLAAEYRVDLIVLARYMQVLSEDLCRQFAGRVINIHHSFLPSFKGARPHQQAFDHGVKLIGATAHYVTAELDEGPIIEQEVARVDHRHSVQRLAAVGRDVEAVALARAVGWHAEHRVLLNDTRTVVFD